MLSTGPVRRTLVLMTFRSDYVTGYRLRDAFIFATVNRVSCQIKKGLYVVHTLKTDGCHFQNLWDRLKTFELRKNDRGYAVDHQLECQETTHTGAEMAAGAPLGYSKRWIRYSVIHMIAENDHPGGLQPGWVIMSLRELSRGER